MAIFNSKLLVYQRVISLPLPDSCKKYNQLVSGITGWFSGWWKADLSMSIISMLMQRKRTCIRQMSYSVDNMWIISDCWQSVFSDSFSAICLHLELGLDRITRYSTIIPKHKHVSSNCKKKDNNVWGLALQPCAVDSRIFYPWKSGNHPRGWFNMGSDCAKKWQTANPCTCTT